jgi:LysM domain
MRLVLSIAVAVVGAIVALAVVTGCAPTAAAHRQTAPTAAQRTTPVPTAIPSVASTPVRMVWEVDSGPRQYAMGTSTLDAFGDPQSYIVAPGDHWYNIAERFGGDGILWQLNCARRRDTTLYIGDVLNLSPYTIGTVGDEHGSTSPASPATAVNCLQQTGLPPQH